MVIVIAVGLSVIGCAAAGLILLECLPAIRARQNACLVETCQAVQRADQAEAELARVREKRYPHPTVEMLEDLSAILLDIDGELHQTVRYLFHRLKDADRTLAAGRSGPYSYQPADTSRRPARPGATVKTWTM